MNKALAPALCQRRVVSASLLYSRFYPKGSQKPPLSIPYDRRYKSESLSERLRLGIAALRRGANDSSAPPTTTTPNEARKSVTESCDHVSSDVKDQSKEIYESSRPLASSLLSRAKGVSMRSLQLGKEGAISIIFNTGQIVASKFKEGVVSATGGLKQKALTVVSSAHQRTKNVIYSAASSVKEQTRSTLSSVTQPLLDSLARVTGGMNASKVWRALWWWSLAAIGVYGVATTVPTEIVKQLLRKRDDNDKKE
jgi:hypothetical protein